MTALETSCSSDLLSLLLFLGAAEGPPAACPSAGDACLTAPSKSPPEGHEDAKQCLLPTQGSRAGLITQSICLPCQPDTTLGLMALVAVFSPGSQNLSAVLGSSCPRTRKLGSQLCPLPTYCRSLLSVVETGLSREGKRRVGQPFLLTAFQLLLFLP